MRSNGVSIKGSYHDINQDSFLSKEYSDGYILVLSDGMGSKKLSHYGSKAICESVYEIVSSPNNNLDLVSFKDILYSCHENWKRKLYEFDISDCYATMLVAVVTKDRIQAARLGDGFVSIFADNEVHCLFDKKDDFFANETDCLRESFDRDAIEVLDIEYTNFQGVVSCSDGIEIGTMQEDELISFTQDFVTEYAVRKEMEIIDEIGDWLVDWPGCDDKTIAFLLNDKIEVEDCEL